MDERNGLGKKGSDKFTFERDLVKNAKFRVSDECENPMFTPKHISLEKIPNKNLGSSINDRLNRASKF